MKTLVVIVACTLGSFFAVYINSSDDGSPIIVEAYPCERDICYGLTCTIANIDTKCSIGPDASCTTTMCY
jgi:hypothetical protein